MKKWVIFISLGLTLLIVLPVYFNTNQDSVETTKKETLSISISEIETKAAEYQEQEMYTEFILERIPESNVFLDGHDHDDVGHDEASDSELIEGLFTNFWSGLYLKDQDMVVSSFSSESIQNSFNNDSLDFNERLATINNLMDEFYKPGDPIGVNYSYEEIDSDIRNAELIIQYAQADIVIPIKLKRNLLSDHEMSMRIETPIDELTNIIKKQASSL